MGDRNPRSDALTPTRLSDSRWLLISLTVTVSAIVGVLALLSGIGWLRPQDASQRMTAVLALAGTSLTGAISLAGLALQRQANWRTQLAAADEGRRLKLEAAMRAASLLAPANGGAPDAASIGAALLALCDLDQVELAVALLGDTWHPVPRRHSVSSITAGVAVGDAPSGATPGPDAGSRRPGSTGVSKVSTATAILVIDKGLSKPAGGAAQLMAAEILCRNARALSASSMVDWPHSIDGLWREDLPYMAKLLIIDGLVSMTINDKPVDLALSALAVRLYGIYRGETNSRVRQCASRMLHAIMPVLEQRDWDQLMGRAREAVCFKDLVGSAKEEGEAPRDLLGKLEEDRVKKLGEWSRLCAISPMPDYSLATAN
jgi:hypothetical protein